MAQSHQPTPDKAIFDSAVSKFKETRGEFESTYKKLFKNFTRGSNDVPPNIPDDNPDFIHMTRADVVSTHVANQIKETSTKVNTIKDDIENDFTRLAQLAPRSPAAKERHSTLLPNFTGWKNDVEKLDTERRELTRELEQYLGGMRKGFADIDNAIESGKPAAAIRAMFDQIQKQREELVHRVVDLNKREKNLEANLKDLYVQTQNSLTTLVATGTVSYQQLQNK